MRRTGIVLGLFAVLLVAPGCPTEPSIEAENDAGVNEPPASCEAVDCSGHGSCVSGACDCLTGYSGQSCAECATGFELRAGLCLPVDPPLANYPLEIIQPQAGLDTTNRFYKAYPGLEYNVRLAVIGGAYPFLHSLDTAPAGMTIAPGTGVISWPQPVEAGSPHAVTARVVDQAGDAVTVSWTVTVTTDGFRFLDAVNGKTVAEGGTGTSDNPWRTLGDMYEGNDYDAKYRSSYVGEFLYFREGTYFAGDAYVEDTHTDGTGRVPFSTNGKPAVWLAYPGLATKPVIDLAAGHISFYGGSDDIYFDGFAFTNMTNYTRKGISLSPGDNVTVRRSSFTNLPLGGIGGSNNQSAIMIPDSHGAFGNHYAFTENTFEGIDAYAIIAYTSNKVLFADNDLRDFESNFPGIGPKSSNTMWFIRANRLENMPGMRSIWLYNAGDDTADQEVSYNLVITPTADAALSVGQSGSPTAGVAHIFRNTFIGPVSFQNVTTSKGPYYLRENVIINDASTADHTTCGNCTNPELVISERNLVGTAADGIVDAQGRLQGTWRDEFLGTRGHELP